MPPKDAGGKLTAAEIADLEAWVQSGAFDPRLEKVRRRFVRRGKKRLLSGKNGGACNR